MKYVIEKNNEKQKLANYNINIVGLNVTPKNEVPGLNIKAKKVILIDSNLRDSYIKQRIDRKIDKIIKFMLRILNDDDTTEEDTGLVLDEINRLKGIVINKYREYMLDSEFKSLLTKLILIEEEFKKSYNDKIFMNYMPNSYYEEELLSGRGR
ncbi:MAG: hypothetical protein IKR57_05015 [Bacilli bacterium]|nr:hypothetical protein [Bacilli bacterium]